jgi:hypothetical protein
MGQPIRPIIKTAQPEPGGLFSNGQIAEITGLSVRRLKEFQTERLVHVRDLKNTGVSAWNMSARGDVAAFVVLSQLRDRAGVNEATLRAASVALYGWSTPQQEPLPWYPLLHALYGAAREPREMWLLRLRFLRNDQNDQERITGYCYGESNPPRIVIDPADPWQADADLHLLLTPALTKLVASFRKFAGHAPRLDA